MKEKIEQIFTNVDNVSRNVDGDVRRLLSDYCVQMEKFFEDKFYEYSKEEGYYITKDGMTNFMSFINNSFYNNIFEKYIYDNKKYIEAFQRVCYSTKSEILKEQPNFEQALEEFRGINKMVTSKEEYDVLFSGIIRRYEVDFGYDFIKGFVDKIEKPILASKGNLDNEISSVREKEIKPVVDFYEELQQNLINSNKSMVAMEEELHALDSMKKNLGVSYDEMSVVTQEFIKESTDNINLLNERVFSILKPEASIEEKKEQLDKFLGYVGEDFSNHFPNYCNNLSNDLIPKCTGKVTDPSVHVMDNPEVAKEVNDFCRGNKISDPLAVYTKIDKDLREKFNLPDVNSHENPVGRIFLSSYGLYRDAANNYSKKIIVNELGQIQEVVDLSSQNQQKKDSYYGI